MHWTIWNQGTASFSICTTVMVTLCLTSPSSQKMPCLKDPLKHLRTRKVELNVMNLERWPVVGRGRDWATMENGRTIDKRFYCLLHTIQPSIHIWGNLVWVGAEFLVTELQEFRQSLKFGFLLVEMVVMRVSMMLMKAPNISKEIFNIDLFMEDEKSSSTTTIFCVLRISLHVSLRYN